MAGSIEKSLLPEKGDAWLAASDEELVCLVKAAKAKGLAIGSELGIISYNDTPLKEIIEGGVTVVSADFRKMGLLAGRMLRRGEQGAIRIDTELVLRNTL